MIHVRNEEQEAGVDRAVPSGHHRPSRWVVGVDEQHPRRLSAAMDPALRASSRETWEGAGT